MRKINDKLEPFKFEEVENENLVLEEAPSVEERLAAIEAVLLEQLLKELKKDV